MTPVAGLLDTNILIDISRGYPSAIDWMQANSQLVLAIPSLVQMEMILGTKNKVEQDKVTRILQPFAIIYPNEIDAEWAVNYPALKGEACNSPSRTVPVYWLRAGD